MGTKPAKVTQRPSSPTKNCEKGTRSSLKLPGQGSNLLKSRRLLMSTTLVPRGGGEQRYHRGSRVPHTRPRRGVRASRGPPRVVASRWRVRPRGCTAGAAPPRRVAAGRSDLAPPSLEATDEPLAEAHLGRRRRRRRCHVVARRGR
eukprot:scaffold201_cov59-Phaeocystis_antarctica.AAC.2